MEACQGVEREVARITEKFDLLKHLSLRGLEDLVEAIKDAKENLSRGRPFNPAENVTLLQLTQTTKDHIQKTATDHRELHSSVSKVGKAIDRNFMSDYDSTSRTDIFSSPEQTAALNSVILQHFYRKGQLDIADALIKDAKLDEKGAASSEENRFLMPRSIIPSKDHFVEMHAIVESLQQRELRPALEWAIRNRKALISRGSTVPTIVRSKQTRQGRSQSLTNGRFLQSSGKTTASHTLLDGKDATEDVDVVDDDDDDMMMSIQTASKADGDDDDDGDIRLSVSSHSALEMKLHRLQFLELLKGDRTKLLESVEYARRYFAQFLRISSHDADVANLMGALMYAGPKLQDSPYGHLLRQSAWDEVIELFTKDACAIIGLSVESPLAIAINAGCVALPSLLNIKQVMLQHQGVWSNKDELPIEIDVGQNSRFHSIFACPILRQQTSDLNPPIRLTCGHCISKDALAKLSSGHKLKCPYCPVEQNPNDARQIFF